MRNLILIMLLPLALPMFSQYQIIVQGNGETSLYENFTDAVTNSVNGDTIYLPGMNSTGLNVTINKRLVIIGAGHYPDSTQATGITLLGGSFSFGEDADSSFITGVYFTGNVYLAASSTDTLKDVVFERCRIRDLVIGSAGMVKNLVVSESVLKTINGNSNMKDCYISQNIFTAQLFSINNSTFSHNIFLYNEYDLLNTAESCLFIDNIICDDAITLIAHDVLNCMFVNNIFVGTINIPDGSNDGSDNIENQSLADIFVDVPDNFFDYSYDYNLVGTSPGNDAASDTTDIGIYGTSVPYKDGAVPFNPHIVSKNIDLKLNELNQLNIEIKVSAQDH